MMGPDVNMRFLQKKETAKKKDNYINYKNGL
jgi:hypothetical protein